MVDEPEKNERPLQPPVTIVTVTPTSRSSVRFQDLTTPEEDPGSMLRNLHTPVKVLENVRVNSAPPIPLEAIMPNPQDPKPEPLIPIEAIRRPVEAIVGYKIDGIDPNVDSSERRDIADTVKKLEDEANERRMTIFAADGVNAFPIIRPTGLSPDYSEAGRSVYKAYLGYASVDPAISRNSILAGFGMFPKSDHWGGDHTDSLKLSAIIPPSNLSDEEVRAHALLLAHEGKHGDWEMNDDLRAHRRQNADGYWWPASALLKTPLDRHAMNLANEAHAYSSGDATKLLAALAEYKKLKADPATPASEKRIGELEDIMGPLVSKMPSHGERIKEAIRLGSSFMPSSFDQLGQQTIHEVMAYVDKHKDLPPEIRTQLFLQQLKTVSEDYAKHYRLDKENGGSTRLSGTGLTLTSQDFINWVRGPNATGEMGHDTQILSNNRTGPATPAGPSYLEAYMKAHPEFDLKKYIEELPWARAVETLSEADRVAVFKELDKYDAYYNPDDAKRIRDAEQQYQTSLQRPNFSGAVDAYRKLTGKLSPGLENHYVIPPDFSKIEDPAVRARIEALVRPQTEAQRIEAEQRTGRLAAKEIMLEMARPTDRSLLPQHQYTPANLAFLTMGDPTGSAPDKRPSIQSMQRYITDIARELPPQQQLSTAQLRTVTDQVMRSEREESMRTLGRLHRELNNATTYNDYQEYRKYLDATLQRAAQLDDYFKKEIQAGTIQPAANLANTSIDDRMSHAQLIAQIDKKGAELKAKADVSDKQQEEQGTPPRLPFPPSR